MRNFADFKAFSRFVKSNEISSAMGSRNMEQSAECIRLAGDRLASICKDAQMSMVLSENYVIYL